MGCQFLLVILSLCSVITLLLQILAPPAIAFPRHSSTSVRWDQEPRISTSRSLLTRLSPAITNTTHGVPFARAHLRVCDFQPESLLPLPHLQRSLLASTALLNISLLFGPPPRAKDKRETGIRDLTSLDRGFAGRSRSRPILGPPILSLDQGRRINVRIKIK